MVQRVNDADDGGLFGKDPHTYELVGNEIRRDDGFVVTLATCRTGYSYNSDTGYYILYPIIDDTDTGSA